MRPRPHKRGKKLDPSPPPSEGNPSWLGSFLGKLLPVFRKSRRHAHPQESREHSLSDPGPAPRHRSTARPPSDSSHTGSRRPLSSGPSPHSPADADFPVIVTTEDLREAVSPFATLDRIALDTEADSLHCYFDKLCLIQISIPGQNLLVDPLAEGVDLEPLFCALERKTVVIHSADYDLRLLRRCGYSGPTVLFDTMIAARLLGAKEFGLAALLHQHFGVTLAKASQKANWAIRPLPREMLEYAVNDTVNLLALAEIQEARLRELGRLSWFEQMCERQIRSSSLTKEKDPDTLWRISGYADLPPRGAALLRALWNWRDSEAQAADRPAFHILNNDLLLEFAARFDRGESVDPKHLRGNRRTRFFEAADQALALSEEFWPQIVRKPRLRSKPEHERRFRELKKHRDEVAEHLGIDPTLIAPKATLEQLARQEIQAMESLLPWQRDCLPPL